MIWFGILILATGAERIVEVMISNRHAAWAFARGGREYGQRHYPFMVVLHTGMLLACLVEVFAADRPFIPVLGWPMLALAIACQGLRYWCIGTLGKQWNARVIVVPGLGRITGGPYRLFTHPNYVVVIAEGIALPLVHTAWLTALVFTVLNAILLFGFRIPTEERALVWLDASTPGFPTKAAAELDVPMKAAATREGASSDAPTSGAPISGTPV